MRDYELILILQPDLEEGAVNDLVEKVKAWITEGTGSVAKVDFWGKRRLAYAIRKQREGQYIHFKLQMPPTLGITIEHNLRFQEPVMRFLITQL